ncbi:hypothetical protein B0H16DRAFT_1298084 [Mycena metata]|uniref:BTB domain-containing protein n=1 Tax=Mycena metata TaxID=1033252 RepID=A0AAD7P060_9AGAR|nr:hypothetical protein B0H16DRAFT_1298084 [Mycena metata]
MSHSDAPPPKRQRTEDSTTRSDIWYKDGSVILQVENIQSRVHWSLLAQHSSFFRDLEHLPQPPDPDQPTVDGCPVIVLSGDTRLDVDHLLRVLYDSCVLFLRRSLFPIIAALVRLGRKYQFTNLLNLAVERLSFENPTTLEAYDARVHDGVYTWTRIVEAPGTLFDILTLARENNILSVLPCAYYRVILQPRASLFDGIKREDGTVASLRPAELRQCLLGHEKLLKRQAGPGYTAGWLRQWDFDADCTNLVSCTQVRTGILQRYLETLNLWALGSVSRKGIIKSLCTHCKNHLEESFLAGRRKFWEELPSFFDLQNWAELSNDL